MKNEKGKFSKVVLILVAIIFLAIRFAMPRWDTHNVLAILSWDVMGYYLYLPATFIYGDLAGLNFIPDIFKEYAPAGSFYHAIQLENGNHVMKYPMGLSIMYFPFFIIAHASAYLFGYTPDGFTEPYQLMIALSAIFYNLAGLILLRKVLLDYFSDIAIAAAIILLVLGSNYIQYVAIDGAMPHGYLFFLYSAVIYCSWKWHKSPKLIFAVLIGLCIGLATISRPTELVMAIIPLLWGIHDKKSYKAKIELILQNKIHLIALVGMSALTVLPQLLYWKAMTGNFLFYTYEEQGFDWFSPHYDKVLWGWEKGWFVYTPLMGLPILGLIVLYRKAPTIFVALFTFFAINLYLVVAWSQWKYAGSYSCRALVQSYAMLLFPFVAVMGYIIGNKVLKFAMIAIAILLIPLNLFQLWQYNKGILKAEGNSKEYYQRVFLKTKMTSYDQVFLQTDEGIKDESKFNVVNEYLRDYESDTVSNAIIPQAAYQSKLGFRSTNKEQYGSPISFKASELPLESGKEIWLKVSTWVKFDNWESRPKLVASIKSGDKTKKWRGISLFNGINPVGQWGQVYYYFSIPKDIDKDDQIECYILNFTGAQAFIDDFRIEVLEQK